MEGHTAIRVTSLVLVAAVHALFLSLLRTAYEEDSAAPKTPHRRAVLFVVRAPPEPKPPPVDAERKTASERDRDSKSSTPLTVTPRVAESNEAHTPSIDWKLEAARAAAAIADKAIDSRQPECNQRAPGRARVPNCPQPQSTFEWAPPKAGFSGGLPYLRVGENCAVGLGFFGCRIGKKDANGHLFDRMRDPDRERSSVPLSNEIR